MRAKLFVFAGLLAVAFLAGGASTAIAQDPVDLGQSHVVDQAGVLGNSTGTIDNAIAKLSKDHGIDLFVVYVDNFTNPTSAESWANDTATKNNLGPRDYLLAVATEGRAYFLSGDSSGPVSQSQLAAIESNNIEPALKAGDWSGAAVGAAHGLASAAGGGNSGFVWFFVILAVVVIAVIVFFIVRSRRKSRGRVAGSASGHEDELLTLPLPDLQRRAGSALVQTDDAIRTSEEELGFAVASYGVDAAAPFQHALDEAKATLTQAFQFKQKLDDAEPDSEQETRQWNADIVRLCERANSALDEQARAFDELRALEKNIPATVGAVEKDAAAVLARLDASARSLSALSERYTDATLLTVADNPAQARERLTFVDTALRAAEAKSAEGDTGTAAVGVRAAEESVAQAALLLDAIDRLAADLSAAQTGIDSTVPELERDVFEARALAASGDPQGAIATASATAEQVLQDVKSHLAAGKVNPLELVQKLEVANQNIDQVLNAARDKQAQDQRALEALEQTVWSAQSRVSAAADFITARRGAVGAEARTRLAEAGRLVVLAQNTAASDPGGALAQAQRAEQLAAESIQLAQRDVGGFSPSGGAGGLFGGGTAGNGEMGAVLGGILINSVLGGGGSGGGASSRVSSPGSFGGSGTRARRGGGRF
jgi:TPM domain